MERKDSIYIKHILDAISRIGEYTQGIKYENFMNDHLIQDGVIRQLETIGEASKIFVMRRGEGYSTLLAEKRSKYITFKYNLILWIE